MKFLRFLPFIAAVLTCENALSDIKKCQELKEEIEAKINDKGVRGYFLTIVPTSQIKDQGIVGSCDGGKYKVNGYPFI
jgi:hypothetical protein